jgi:hypothetical protein
MEIDESELHFSNTSFTIRESFEPGSNVTVERALHPEKQYSQSSTTDERTLNDKSDDQFSNARLPIDDSLHPGANVTSQRDLQ